MNRPGGNRRGVLDTAAAAILLVMGLLIGWFGIWTLSEGIGKGPGSGGVREALLLAGLGLALVAALHIFAAAQILARRGRRLGLVIGTIGTLAGAVGAWLAIGGLTLSGRIDDPLILLPLPYLIVLVALLSAERRSTQRAVDRTPPGR
jgi:hypothetical protein